MLLAHMLVEEGLRAIDACAQWTAIRFVLRCALGALAGQLAASHQAAGVNVQVLRQVRHQMLQRTSRRYGGQLLQGYQGVCIVHQRFLNVVVAGAAIVIIVGRLALCCRGLFVLTSSRFLGFGQLLGGAGRGTVLTT